MHTHTLSRLRALGFDRSTKAGKTLRPACSNCEALVINGYATHETGCPNDVQECKGCNAMVPRGHHYCADCA